MHTLTDLGKSLSILKINVQELTDKHYEIHFQHDILKMLESKPSSLSFPRIVSIMYITLNELYKNEVIFLQKQFSIPKDASKLVNNFRTYFNHSVDLNIKSDQKINQFCIKWISNIIGTQAITHEAHWDALLNGFISECIMLINNLNSTLISNLPEIKDLYNEFEAQIINSKICDEILEETLELLGLEFDVRPTRALYFEQWKTAYESSIKSNQREKKLFLSTLIEDSLIKNTFPKLPVSGSDLVDTFDIYENDLLFSVLKDCYINFQWNYYNGTILSKNELIDYVGQKYSFERV